MPGPPVRNTNYQAAMDQRRTMVARLRLRGLTQREVVEALEKTKLRNPGGKPWSLATVNRDIAAVRSGWRAEAREAYGKHVARMLAEYREVRREAWREGDHDLVLKTCQMECKLLGLDQPDRLVVDWRREAEEAGITDAGDIFEELVQQAANSLAGSAGGDGGGSAPGSGSPEARPAEA